MSIHRQTMCGEQVPRARGITHLPNAKNVFFYASAGTDLVACGQLREAQLDAKAPRNRLQRRGGLQECPGAALS